MNHWIAVLLTLSIPGILLEPLKPLTNDYQGEFSWNFYKKYASPRQYTQNILSSPYYIREIFSCLSNVSSPSESLKKQYSSALKLTGINLIHMRYDLQRERFKCRPELSVTTMALGFGTEHTLDQSFRNVMDHCRSYQTRLTVEHRSTMIEKINKMFSEASNNQIREYLGPSDIDTSWKFLMMNALVINVPWKYRFEEDHVTTCPFYSNKNSKTLTDFLRVEANLKYGYFPQWKVKAVEVPLRDGSPFSCLLMLPTEGSLANMMKDFNHNRFRDIYKGLSQGKTTVIIPKGSMRMSLKVKVALKSMGLKDPFDEDLLKVHDTTSRISIGEVMQKLKVKFDSGGAEEAQESLDRSMGNLFTAHEPFVYVIFDRQELMPIIVGHLVQPKQSEKVKSHVDMCQNPPRWMNAQ